MSLGQRIVVYALFFIGSLCFLAAGIRDGDMFVVIGAVFFIVAELWAMAYLELSRERDRYNLLRRPGEDERRLSK